MGIRFLCPACGKRINVKEQQAGLRGICPKCGAGVDIPLESTILSRKEQEAATMAVARTARANAAAADAIDPIRENPAAMWYALPPGAPKPYGPIDGAGLVQWFQEGRITPDSMVWRQDWPEWRAVVEVWPTSPPGSRPVGAGESYKLKPVMAEADDSRPPVMAGRSAAGIASPAAARAASSLPKVPTLGPAVSGSTAAALGSAAPAAGVYYRRRSNGAYLTTVVVLILLVLALGGVMVWVIMRDPPPVVPPKKPDAAPSGSSSRSTLPDIPALNGPPASSPSATGSKGTAAAGAPAAKGTTTGS